VLGTAAQGVALTVLRYTRVNGGWFAVRGLAATGWISAQPALSAPGVFRSYRSSRFGALYPATWREVPVPAPAAATSSVAFRPASGAGDIVVTTAASVTQLPNGRSGYGLRSVSQVLVCGITAGLVVFQRAAAAPAATPTSVPESLDYLAVVRLPIGKHGALGLYADMPDLGPTLQVFRQFVAAVTFSAPQCPG
jgi:hypothetical protein